MDNGWWRLLVGILIGALAPSLIAWGSMSAKIEANKTNIKNKVECKVFEEYKKGNTELLKQILKSLERIDTKIDNRQ